MRTSAARVVDAVIMESRVIVVRAGRGVGRVHRLESNPGRIVQGNDECEHDITYTMGSFSPVIRQIKMAIATFRQ